MRRWIVRGVAVATVLALVGGLAAFQWWRTHPDLFDEPGDAADTIAELEVGEQMYFGMTFTQAAQPTTVTLHSAEPRVVNDTADSTIDLTVCTLVPGELGTDASGELTASTDDAHPEGFDPTVVFSMRPDDIADVCVESSGFDDEPFRLARDRDGLGQQILMLISGSKPGSVEIDGIDLEYSYGNQHGTRPVGEHMIVEIG